MSRGATWAAEGFEFHLRFLECEHQDPNHLKESATQILSAYDHLFYNIISKGSALQNKERGENSVWIKESDLKQILDDHSALISINSPSIEELTKSGTIKPFSDNNENGFFFINFDTPTTRALARYWEKVLVDSEVEEDEKLSAWLEKANCFYHAKFETPHFMSPSSREVYLNKVLEWLTVNYSKKIKDFDSSAPPSKNSPLKIWLWGRQVENQRSRSYYAFTEDRLTFIGQIVKFDNRHGNYLDRCSRIRTLLKSGSPSTVIEVAERICSLNPRSIAWILADPETLALGLALIEHISIPEAYPWQMFAAEDRNTKTELTRTQFWNSAIGVALEVLQESRVNWQKKEKALFVYELTLLFNHIEQEIGRSEYFRPDIVHSRRDQALARKNGWYRKLAETKGVTKIHRSSEITSPKITEEFAEELVSIVLGEYKPRRDNFESMPQAEFTLLSWLLEELDDSEIYNKKLQNLKPIVANGIRKLYTSELLRSKWGEKSYDVTWIEEADVTSACNWLVVVKELASTSQLELLLKPVDFEEEIRQLPPTNKQELYEVQSSQQPWVMKIRTHVRLLIHIWRGLKGKLHNSIEANKVEEALAELLTFYCEDMPAKGKLNILDKQHNPNGFRYTRLPRLLPEIVDVLNGFKPFRRESVLSAIHKHIDELGSLITIAGGLKSAGSRKEIEKRIEEVFNENGLEKEFWITSLEQMAGDAANSGMVEVAKKVLDYGDKITDNHGYKDKWKETAFLIRALIAYHEKDRKSLESLKLPEKENKQPVLDREREKQLEKNRTFLLAVLDIYENPESAIHGLEQLKKSESSFKYSINLFRAKIEKAKKISSPKEQILLLEGAISEWSLLKDTEFSPLDETEKNNYLESMLYCELECLLLLNRSIEAESFYFKIPDQFRLSVPFLDLFIPFLKSKKKNIQINEIRDEAKIFHTSNGRGSGEEWKKIEEHLELSLTNIDSPSPTLSIISRDDRIETLKRLYPVLQNATPRQLVDVIRGGNFDVGKFILQNLISVIHLTTDQNEVLGKFNRWTEPEQTHLLSLLLKNRLEEWCWTVTAELKGGKTNTEGPGYRDIVIDARNIGKLAIVEALKLSSAHEKSIIDHMRRLFTYDATGDNYGFILVFSHTANAKKLWTSYSKIIQKKSELFPPPQANMEELDPRDVHFGQKIKIGKTRHLDSGLMKTIFHILVDMRQGQ